MKRPLVLALLMVSAVLTAYGQKADSTGPVIVKVPAGAKSAAATFPREKFDPARDPKADVETAVKTATSTGKRIILDVGGEWCGWCVYMDKFFYENAAINRLREENFVWVKINFSEANENKEFLSKYPEIAGYPHLFILDPAGKLLQSQDTSILEAGKGYDLAKFTGFLRTWIPKRTTTISLKSIENELHFRNRSWYYFVRN